MPTLMPVCSQCLAAPHCSEGVVQMHIKPVRTKATCLTAAPCGAD